MEAQVSYGGFLIRPVVTATESGRFTASAVLTGPYDRDQHTVGAEVDFGRREEAVDRAIELAIAEIDRRRFASDGHVKG